MLQRFYPDIWESCIIRVICFSCGIDGQRNQTGVQGKSLHLLITCLFGLVCVMHGRTLVDLCNDSSGSFWIRMLLWSMLHQELT